MVTPQEIITNIRKNITYYDNQKHLAEQQISIARQQLEDIDHFFWHYGYDNEFNCVTQKTAYERSLKEGHFDKIVQDIEYFNEKLTLLGNELHIIYSKEFEKKNYITANLGKDQVRIIMAVKTSTSQENFLLPEIIGIGGITSIDNNLFKVSIEEAVLFLEAFKITVNEKSQVLQEIGQLKNTVDQPKAVFEKKADLIFEDLQQELQSWRFGKGGVSLKK